MRNTIILLSIIMLALAGTTHAQPDSLWSRTFGGRSGDGSNSIIQTADGGYVLAGYTRSFGAGFYDMWLVKINAEGDSIWSQAYGGENYDNCYSIIQTADGGYALAGCTNSFGAYDHDMWLVKTDVDGDSLWSRTFGGENGDYCESIIQTADGGYVLAGITGSFGAGWNDMWLVKTNVDGDSLWSRTFGGENSDYCESIIQTADGGYILAGHSTSFGAGERDMWLVKTDADGDSLWSRTFGGGGDERFHSIIQTLDGGYTLAGNTRSFGAGGEDMYLVKTDADGDSLWSRTFGGEDSDWCNSIIQTTDGGYALGGGTYSFGGGWKDMWLIKTGPDPVSVPPESFIPHPSIFILSPAYPNPFNSTTSIRYGLPYPTHVLLQIYNPSGQQIGTLFEGLQHPGIHTTSLTATDLPSGLYFVRLKAAGELFTQKVMLVR